MPVLAERGFDVSVFVTGPFGPVAADLQAAGIVIVPRRPLRIGENWPGLLRRLVRYSITSFRYLKFAFSHRRGILHFFLPQSTVFGGIFTIFWHPRLIASQRGMFTYRRSSGALMTWVEKLVMKHVSLNLANCRFIADMLEEDGVARDKIRIIYSGLSPHRMEPPNADRAALRESLEIDSSTFVIVTLANLIPYKGHFDLMHALAELHTAKKLGENWLLLCIGRDAQLEKKLKDFAKKNGFDHSVRFLGERDEAPALLRVADIAVQPSHEEGLSNAIIEEMAARLPVIATNVGGNSEALANGTVGVLVPAQEPALLADAIAELYGAPERREALGQLAGEYVKSHFNLCRCVDGYESVYRELSGGGQRR
jgi:glycosyltransferase involved in cell wall biosynthesis